MLVINASLALAWCFGDEKSPAADKAIDQVSDEGALVPSLWRLEVANVLFDSETDSRAWSDTFVLARSQRLTLYDAAYLELAMRHGAELATLDHDLAQAARRMGVPVLS